MLMLTLSLNTVIEINVFRRSSINTRVNADAQCEWALWNWRKEKTFSENFDGFVKFTNKISPSYIQTRNHIKADKVSSK